MFSFETDAMLVNDREDLIAVLRMRFGEISGGIIEKIYDINDMNSLQRLILAAANAMNWNVFLEELQASEYSFRLLGEEFNPVGNELKGRDDRDGEKEK
ncbi:MULTISPECIES: hypothetical protein [Bacillus cereus group]|uniref:Uncharacterized protein n=2 Tax=Bacillus thuringiensis TaxID=1428 RepID=A0A242W1K2_BACTU|nr:MULTISPECIES: hypothetical protein [Bacillus cereus group]EEM58308.1 hypothetical protein bthur0007_35850 [Bacillus thuringiensis serovar monterrey BGSC 4AJ1]MEB9672708.1 hypothetical protein [Bacillus anthracis]OTW44688.1 hypothetical protein BK699_30280 [Bacillus thuringiensis serovar mexicanensis]OTW97040.1 hypothetical protein BK705_24685 [Bacillus thuringiensis serovar monterrey]